jgi:hypothetical protein
MRWVAGLTGIMVGLGGAAQAAERDDAATVVAIARDIAALKDEFPQLATFSPANAGVGGDPLAIDYEYRTHRQQPVNGRPIGGWSGGVPHPDDDGVWFFIHLYDAATARQIDTQPAIGQSVCLGKKRVTFLILEGKETKPLALRVDAILRSHGATPC